MSTSDSDMQMHQASPGLTELLGRAITDADFRELLYQERAGAVSQYRLTDTDLKALDNLSRETLEEHAQQFAQGRPTEITIMIVIRVRF